jgi:hypothetical protein
VIAHLADHNAGLLFHFAAHGFLNRLALIDKTGQGRVPPGSRQAAAGLSEQTIFTV